MTCMRVSMWSATTVETDTDELAGMGAEQDCCTAQKSALPEIDELDSRSGG
jgi:hypothetical protein